MQDQTDATNTGNEWADHQQTLGVVLSTVRDNPIGTQVAEAAIRIAQRYPDLTKAVTTPSQHAGFPPLVRDDPFTTTDYIIVARLALGMET